jgi:hypothetical protein
MVGLLESAFPSWSTLQFLGAVTILQFWWIAIWGLAYLFVGWFAGANKQKEAWLYIGLLIVSLFVVQMNPDLIHRL